MEMDFARNVSRKRSINITPLIDIIFLLVVFFMLTSEFITSQVFDLNVSSISDKNQVQDTDGAIVISLTKGNQFILNGNSFDISRLKSKIGSLVKEDKERSIILASNDGVNVQSLVSAMDQIKKSGGVNISLR